MANEPKGDSKYALKYALRRSRDNGKENPMPRPFHMDYIKVGGEKVNNHEWKYNPPLPKEDHKLIARFRGDYQIKPKHVKVGRTIKYDHYKLNYYGYAS